MSLDWIASSWLNGVMVNNAYMFPLFEILHFVGLCLLVGALTIVDLRLLGMAPALPLHKTERFVRWAVFGFSINLTTGIGFFFADPFRYYPNISFRIKMLLVLLAGINLIWYQLTVAKKIKRIGDSYQPGVDAKIIATLSLSLWVGVILFGRLIPYLE